MDEKTSNDALGPTLKRRSRDPMTKFLTSIEEVICDLLLDVWDPVVLSLQRGDPPDRQRVVLALRGPYEVPPEARKYLADSIEGRVRRPRGRPKSCRSRSPLFARNLDIQLIYKTVLEETRNTNKSTRH